MSYRDNEDAYNQVVNAPHKAHLSHELIAAAAAYEAAKAYNDHKRNKGEEVSHSKAKEILAGAAGAFITRMIETKGLDAIDHAKAKRHAEDHHSSFLQDKY